MNEELSNKIIERLNKDSILPIPKWRFNILYGFFWLGALMSVIIGSLAFATILFLIIDLRMHGIFEVSHSALEIMLFIPYLWLIVLCIFILIAKISLRHTKRGHQYRLRYIVASSLILSIIFGSFLTLVGVGKLTHDTLNRTSIYNYTTYDAQDAWDQPIVGRIAGVVLSVNNKNNFIIKDFEGALWHIQIATSTYGHVFTPKANSIVRMSGIYDASSSIFIATSIYEWED